MNTTFPELGYTSGTTTPTLESVGDSDTAPFESLNLTLSRKVLAGERFYGLAEGGFHTVLVLEAAF